MSLRVRGSKHGVISRELENKKKHLLMPQMTA